MTRAARIFDVEKDAGAEAHPIGLKRNYSRITRNGGASPALPVILKKNVRKMVETQDFASLR